MLFTKKNFKLATYHTITALKLDSRGSIVLLLLLTIISRVIPHTPGMSVAFLLCMILAARCSLSLALAFTAASVLATDLLLSSFYDYPLLGAWSLFTYSGFLAVTAGASLLKRQSFFAIFVWHFPFSIGYWLWTNFGVWLQGDLYPTTYQGLLACYVLALPFLHTQLLCCMLALLGYLIAYACRLAMTNKETAMLRA